jgi:hypothetical protein
MHRPKYLCDNCFALASDAGLDWMECTEVTNEPHIHIWKGMLKVSRLDISELCLRKGMC